MKTILKSTLRVVPFVAVALWVGACGGGGSPPDPLASDKRVVIASNGPNAVSTWNEIAFNTISVPGSPAGATLAERVPNYFIDIATVQLAVYDAVMAIAGTHKLYGRNPSTAVAGDRAVAMDAAAIEAAYQVLRNLFPSRGDKYETEYAGAIAALPNGEGKTSGMAIAREVAAGIVDIRANDNRDIQLAPYVPGTEPGQFRGVNPINRFLPYVRPFVTTSHQQFRVPAPYALAGAAYAIDVNEVKTMAGLESSQRSDAQTEIARFYTEAPANYWARNLRQFATANAKLEDNARLLAMLVTAQSDANGACFESKYFYNFWRPTSAIRLADTDGNPDTDADPSWTPVVTTPNHPEYPAAHGCGTGAAMEVVRSFYGTKDVAFYITSTVTNTTHHFERTDDLVQETGDARVWGGMHFRTSTEIGANLGKDVAKWVVKNAFTPLVE